MKVLRVFYYIFFGFFLLLVVAASVIEIFFGNSDAKIKKLFSDPQFPLTHETYTHNGVTLDYYAIGPDTAQRIIFLHGSPGSWDNFTELVAKKELYSTHRLIAVNRIGYGASKTHPGVADLDTQVDFVLPLIRNSVSGKKPVLVGHSMGGPIVVRAAMTHSDLLQGVVSLAGSLAGALEPNEWFRGLYKVFPVNLLMAPPLRSSNDELFTHFRQLDAMQNDWQNISCPVFIFQGLSDNLVDKRNADYAEKKLAHLHQKEIIRMPGEDHFIPWTQEDVIAGYILKLADQ